MMKPSRGRPLLLAASLALLGACGDAPTAVRSCDLPETTIAPAAVEGTTAAHVRAALDDAATRVVPSVLTGGDRLAMRRALTEMTAAVAAADHPGACRAVRESRTILDRAPADIGTSADREVLRLVVDITIAFLASPT